MSSLLTQNILLILLLVFMSATLLLCLDHAVLEGPSAYLSSFVHQCCLPWDPTYQFPKYAEICSPGIQGLPSASLLLLFSSDLIAHHFMVTTDCCWFLYSQLLLPWQWTADATMGHPWLAHPISVSRLCPPEASWTAGVLSHCLSSRCQGS